jgi:hypothetical protein
MHNNDTAMRQHSLLTESCEDRTCIPIAVYYVLLLLWLRAAVAATACCIVSYVSSDYTAVARAGNTFQYFNHSMTSASQFKSPPL